MRTAETRGTGVGRPASAPRDSTRPSPLGVLGPLVARPAGHMPRARRVTVHLVGSHPVRTVIENPAAPVPARDREQLGELGPSLLVHRAVVGSAVSGPRCSTARTPATDRRPATTETGATGHPSTSISTTARPGSPPRADPERADGPGVEHHHGPSIAAVEHTLEHKWWIPPLTTSPRSDQQPPSGPASAGRERRPSAGSGATAAPPTPGAGHRAGAAPERRARAAWRSTRP